METNYRSSNSVVSASSNLIRHNAVRFPKKFISHRGNKGISGDVRVFKADSRKKENQNVLDKIQHLHENGVPYNEMAILFRTNQQAQNPVIALSDAGIPYYSTENVNCIYESFIFSDIQAYVSLACGVGDTNTMLSVLNHPNRYLRESAFRHVHYTKSGLLSGVSYLLETEEHWKYDAAVKNIDLWLDNFGNGKLSMTSSPSEIFRRFQGKGSIHYDTYIADYAQKHNIDFLDVMQIYKDLENDAASFSNIHDWFTAASAYTNKIHKEMKQKNRDGVMITTMHRSKGLEWKYVFIIDADEYIIPHRKSIKNGKAALDEERRLFYVAMTRAKDELYIYSVGTPSRFINEIHEKKAPKTQKAHSSTHKTRPSGFTIYQTHSSGFIIDPQNVPKHMPGHGVQHNKFGRGYVVRYEPGRIVIKFPNIGEKIFQFPETFCRGLLSYV